MKDSGKGFEIFYQFNGILLFFLASLSEFEAEGGQLCIDPSGQTGMESSNEQKPITKWTKTECDSVSKQYSVYHW